MDLSLTLRETLGKACLSSTGREHVSYLLNSQAVGTTLESPDWLRVERINKRIVRDTLDGVLGCGRFSDFPTRLDWEPEVVYRREFGETVLSADIISADHSKLTSPRMRVTPSTSR